MQLLFDNFCQKIFFLALTTQNFQKLKKLKKNLFKLAGAKILLFSIAVCGIFTMGNKSTTQDMAHLVLYVRSCFKDVI